MLSKITLAFAFAIAILTTVPAFVGSSFAHSAYSWQDYQFGSCNTNYYGKGPC
jgi:hypothetical protein